MLKKVQVLVNFLKIKITDKIARGKRIISGITAQAAKLPNLPVTTAAYTTANNDLDTKYQAAVNGDRVAIAARNASEKTWNGLTKQVANYVNYVANGDQNFILACGFDHTTAESTPTHRPDTADGLEAKPIVDHAGSLDVSSNSDSNVKAYLYVAATAGFTVEQQGDNLIISAGAERMVLNVDTHHAAILDGCPSATPLNIYGLEINHVGAGTLTRGKTVQAL
jgi:hypothetical protein